MAKNSQKPPRYRSKNTVYYASACGEMRKAAAEGRIEFRAMTHGHYFGSSLPEDLLKGVCTTGYWNARADQDWSLGWHRNEGLELNFQESGHNGFTTSEQEFELQSGDLAISRPWQLHQIGVPHVRRGIRIWLMLDVGITNPNSKWSWPSWIALTESDKARLSAIILDSCDPVIHLPKKHVEHWKNLLRELQKDDGHVNHSHVAIIINEILYSIMELSTDATTFQTSETPLVMRIIQDFLRDFEARPQLLLHPWTTAQMARQCGMSTASFFARFREFTNTSPNQYLNHIKVKRAVELLRQDPDSPITRIAADVGFATSQYFATVFKKITGKTPSDFTTELRKQQVESPNDP